ncbi:MAG: hypothetical protein WKF77_06185 [Planctomycetaceae bacterium]
MSNPYIAQDVLDQCRDAMRHGSTLDTLAGYLHIDTEYLGRLLQLQTAPEASAAQQDDYLWRAHDALDAVL